MGQNQVLPEQFRILEKLLEFFARSIQERVKADGVLVILREDASRACYIAVAAFKNYLTGRRFKSIRFPMGKGAGGYVMRSGEPLLVNDYAHSPWAWPSLDEITGYRTRNVLAVPMRIKSSVVGVLYAVNKGGAKGFGQKDLDLLENMADIVVLPIECAAMHADSESALRQANSSETKGNGDTPIRQDNQPKGNNLSRMLSAFGESLVGEDKGDFPQHHNNVTDNAEQFFREVNIEFLIHELKGPLNVIDTNIQLLIDRPDQLHPLSLLQTGLLNRIERGTSKARSMLVQLLEVGRAEAHSFHYRTFNPEEVLKEVILEAVESNAADLYERIKSMGQVTDRFDYLAHYGIRLEVASSARNIRMHHDETKFRQITGNLLKNALDYRLRMLLVHITVKNGQIVISFCDDGPGITPEHHEEIFQCYKQINPQPGLARSGHGLGLAVSRILARAMGGDIVLESQPGQGALFKFSLTLSFSPDDALSE